VPAARVETAQLIDTLAPGFFVTSWRLASKPRS